MINPLPLNPLPAFRADDSRSSLAAEMEGFVDEAAVSALINAPSSFRSASQAADLVLSSSDDFAGWPAPAPPPLFREPNPPAPPQPIRPIRRAGPPSWSRPGVPRASRSRPRRWLAGAGAALGTLLLACLLLALARYPIDPAIRLTIGSPALPASADKSPAAPTTESSADPSAVARLTP